MNRKFSCATLSILLVVTIGCSGGGGSTGSSGSGAGGGQIVGSLGPVVPYSTFGPIVNHLVIGDFNGDGRNDVVTSSSAPSQVVIYYQGPAGTFSQTNIINFFTTYQMIPLDLAAGDLNGDGKADLVVSVNPTGNVNVGFLVFYQDPAQGALLPGVGFPATTSFGQYPGVLSIGDIDSDGRSDLILSMAEQRLIIRYQQPNGGLGPETFYDKFPVWQGRVRIVDMDNDGDNDLVVVSGQNELAIIKQNSSTMPGTLSTVPDRYAVQPEGPFAVGDLNNDGKNDLAVIGSGNSGFTSVFLQNNGGTLNLPTRIPTPSIIPWAGATISDINRDGLNDIVSASVDPGFPAGANIFVMYQSPAHTFSAITTYSFPTLSGGGGTVPLVTGDVTGDGKTDVTLTWMDEGLFVMPSTFP